MSPRFATARLATAPLATAPPVGCRSRVRAASTSAGAAAVLAAALVGSLGLAGCDDVSSFSTGEGESYCGAITLGRSFRQGLGPRVQMRLALDASRIDAQGSPGRVWVWEPASTVQPGRSIVAGATLDPFAPIAHDALGDLEIGEGRDRNAIYAVRPEGAAEGMIAVLSLRTDGRVEVRLLRAGAVGVEATADRTQLYGVFLLDRRRGDCGYEAP
jgi:hypothetical protein